VPQKQQKGPIKNGTDITIAEQVTDKDAVKKLDDDYFSCSPCLFTTCTSYTNHNEYRFLCCFKPITPQV
jgi:hypothetical protein